MSGIYCLQMLSFSSFFGKKEDCVFCFQTHVTLQTESTVFRLVCGDVFKLI